MNVTELLLLLLLLFRLLDIHCDGVPSFFKSTRNFGIKMRMKEDRTKTKEENEM
jgi:hypothetical protein